MLTELTVSLDRASPRSCVKDEVAVLGSLVPNSPYGLSGRKATLKCSILELRSCVEVEVAVLGSPSLIVRTVSVNVKRY